MKKDKSALWALLPVCTVCIAVLVGCGAQKRTGSFPVPNALHPVAETRDRDGSEERAAREVLAAERLFFTFDKYDLSPEAYQSLARVAAILKRYPGIIIRINGHSDERGSSEYNYALGEHRARAAYGALREMGVSPAQLEMMTYGKEAPAVAGKTEAVYARNRRDDFMVLPAADCR